MSYTGVREFANESPEHAKADRERIAQERQERLARAQAAQAAQAANEAAQRRDHLESLLMGRFLSNGGTLEEWSKAKDGLVAAHLKEQALHGDDAARQAQAARYSQ